MTDLPDLPMELVFVYALRNENAMPEYHLVRTGVLDVPWVRSELHDHISARMERRYGKRFIGLYDVDVFRRMTEGMPDEVKEPMYTDPNEEPPFETEQPKPALSLDTYWKSNPYSKYRGPTMDELDKMVKELSNKLKWCSRHSRHYTDYCSACKGDPDYLGL